MTRPPEPTSAAPARQRPVEAFCTTRWTRVVAARGSSDEAREALSELCSDYYEPVVAFLRHSVGDEARDFAHGFFATLLAGDALAGARQQGGRFRSYLLGALKHFAANRHASAKALKRGGGVPPLALDQGTDTSPGLQLADLRDLPPDSAFDRDWALAVIGHALADLRSECEACGREERFELLKPWLTGEADHGEQAECARRLGIEVNTLKSDVHRMKRRFRQLVKDRVQGTLADCSAVNDEMTALFAALRGR